MKKIIFPLFMLLIFMLACAATGSKDIKSLRGDTEIPAGSNPVVGMDWQPEDSAYDRTFVHQPPLIPHEVVEYSITTAQNDCLDCHGQKDSDAPMPHKSHYMDRDGQTMKKLSSQWYFCSQCHVGQVDAQPLVENTFKAR
ncbi:MAG: nitrate reductase cytochrome c-type subunit [Deltaproteobacteria bacterium]|nr:nitrate reductase cytochrome c-type subunit [Deltaproteobacteria bacterium]MBW2484155.1 nitrate reductase cytochrome c-type subunit [Deltaproteobacteria bacterium]